MHDPEGRRLTRASQRVLEEFERRAHRGGGRGAPTRAVRKALQHVGCTPLRALRSLRDYDSERFGPFLGVSDEGSAAGEIHAATQESAKVRALGRPRSRDPLVAGVALDGERLGGVGEVIVGPDEHADIWMGCAGRLLVTTNVGTRVNTRSYRQDPPILLVGDSRAELTKAKNEIAQSFRPFVGRSGRGGRPRVVVVEVPRYSGLTASERHRALSSLVRFVRSGKAAGARRAPLGHDLALSVWVSAGERGAREVTAAVDLAARAGFRELQVHGIPRKVAGHLGSKPGLLEFFKPSVVAPLVRGAAARGVRVRSADAPDSDTIARSIWTGLSVARGMGVALGKYGCFPLSLETTAEVMGLVQSWFPTWSAAPVFFVDQGQVREGAIDTGRDVRRGVETWLEAAARAGARVVLIDTIDKPSGRRLLRRSSSDRAGCLGLRQLERLDQVAKGLGIKALWAGGLDLRECFELAKRRVFGVYVTSAVSRTLVVPTSGAYHRDPALATVKEPTREAVRDAKLLLEAGFLTSVSGAALANEIEAAAERLMEAREAADARSSARGARELAQLCIPAWRRHWRTLDRT